MFRALLFLVLVLFSATAFADLQVSWEPPTQRADGTAFDPATEIDHYTLYCDSTAGGPYVEATTQIPGTATGSAYSVPAATFFPAYGDYYCVMTTTDLGGRESAFSQEVLLTYAPAQPNPPTNLLIIVE